jgi:hypothetical protein
MDSGGGHERNWRTFASNNNNIAVEQMWDVPPGQALKLDVSFSIPTYAFMGI